MNSFTKGRYSALEPDAKRYAGLGYAGAYIFYIQMTAVIAVRDRDQPGRDRRQGHRCGVGTAVAAAVFDQPGRDRGRPSPERAVIPRQASRTRHRCGVTDAQRRHGRARQHDAAASWLQLPALADWHREPAQGASPAAGGEAGEQPRGITRGGRWGGAASWRHALPRHGWAVERPSPGRLVTWPHDGVVRIDAAVRGELPRGR